MIILEILDHLGRVKERHKLAGEHIRVGRGYDNDLIINDPFVCARHIEIDLMANDHLQVRDVGSINGLYVYGSRKRVGSLTLNPDQRLRIGHTILRYRTLQHPVAASRQDRLSLGVGNNMLSSTTIQWAGYLLLGLLLYLFAYLNSYQEFEPVAVFRDELLPYALVLFFWAGFWALLSRITTHNFYFTAHSIIATVTSLCMLLYEDYLAPVLRYAFNAEQLVEQLSIVVTVLLIALAFYAHLRFCSAQPSRRLALFAGVFSLVFVGIIYLDDFTGEDGFSNYPEFHDVMMPPSYQLVADISLDEFLAQAKGLDHLLQQQSQDGVSE